MWYTQQPWQTVSCVGHARKVGKKGAEVLSGNTSLNVRAWQPSETINGLRPVPHFKAFMKWKMPWWTVLGLRANHCTTDRKIQRVTYFDRKRKAAVPVEP